MSTRTSATKAILAVAAYLVIAGLLTIVGPSARVRDLSGRLSLPDERPGISPAAISIFFGRIGESGRVLYQRALLLDFLPPVAFALAGWTIVNWSRTRPPRVARDSSWIVRLVIIAAAADIVENLLLLSALQNYPGRPLLGELIGTVIGLKLMSFVTSAVSLAALAVVTVLRAERLRPSA